MSAQNQCQRSSGRRLNRQSWIVPDRSLEESVVKSNNRYLRSYLPADDLAPPMYQEGLLTEEEYEHYKRLKAMHTITANKSEYLTNCLIKRREGYLRKFCEILNNITGAEHIAEYLDEQYMKITKEGVASLSLPGSKWISQSASDLLQKADEPRSRCSKCKSLKHENKRLGRMQRWLEVQLEGLKRENQQLRQTNIFSQNLLQNSKKQLELMEEKERELWNLVPLLQQATTLIECTSVARNGLSVNFNHMEEFFHSFSSPPGPQESTDQFLGQNSHAGYCHIRQISTETQASSRLSSEVSDYEVELEQLSLQNEQTLKELHELTARITATYPVVDSHHHSPSISGVPDHHETSRTRQHPAINIYTQLDRPVSKSDDGYDHLSGTGKHMESKDRTDSKENAHSRSMWGRSSHIHKH